MKLLDPESRRTMQCIEPSRVIGWLAAWVWIAGCVADGAPATGSRATADRTTAVRAPADRAPADRALAVAATGDRPPLLAAFVSATVQACPVNVAPPGFSPSGQPYPGLNFGLPSPWEAVSGDFDGDGISDYLRANGTGAFLYFGNGNGTFTQGFQGYDAGLDFGTPSAWQTISGDFDGDHRTDYARLGDTGAFLYFGAASRGFTSGFQAYVQGSTPLHFGSPSPWQVITGDFNNDHRTDYARLGDTGAWLYYGTADHGFIQGFQGYLQPDQSYLHFGLPSAWQVVAGDFDGDGRTDYARLGDTGAFVFFAEASGNFTQTFHAYSQDDGTLLHFGSPSSWQAIVGDFNGDTRMDYARLGDTGAFVFFGSAARSFTRGFQAYERAGGRPLHFGDPSPRQVITGDFNNDHRTDYARLGGTDAWLYYGRGDGGFTQAFQTYVVGNLAFGNPSPWQVVTGDFNRDGKTDYIRLGGTSAAVFLHK
jgi:hypothetical protein